MIDLANISGSGDMGYGLEDCADGLAEAGGGDLGGGLKVFKRAKMVGIAE